MPSPHRRSPRLAAFSIRIIAFLAALLAIGPAAAVAQDAAPASPAAPAKIGVAVPAIVAIPAMRAKSAEGGQAAELAQILEGFDSKIGSALANTRKFELHVHSDLDKILREQQAQGSGLYQLPEAGRLQGVLKGTPYLLLVKLTDFQDVVKTMEALGNTMRRREIRVSLVGDIVDVARGTVLESVNITLSDTDVKSTPAGVELEKGGDLTEAVINQIADRLAADVASRLTDVIFPAKIVAVTGARFAINRGQGTGIAVGQVWEVSATGEKITDPDTGEVLGAEEIPVGFVRIVQVDSKLSRAEACGENRGIARDCIVRRTDRTSCAPDSPLDRPAKMVASTAAPRQDAARPEPSGERRRTAAIFVRNRDPKIDDSRVEVLEDFLVAGLDDTCFDIVSREDVVSAVAKFAKSGPNAGAPLDPEKDLDKMLSNSASAKAIAEMMSADYLLIASITALSRDARTLRDPARGIDTETTVWTLDATYRILDRSDGSTISTGSAMATDSAVQGGGLKVERDVLPGLLRESAAKMASAMRKRCEAKGLRAPGALVEASLDIRAEASELAIPDIVKDAAGNWVVATSPFAVTASGFTVEIDGVLRGTTPVSLKASSGLHRLRVSRPDFEPFESMVNIRADSAPITVPMRLTAAGLERVKGMSAFLQGLKKDQQLTEAQVKVLEGYAEFFRNSRYSIDHKSDHKSEHKSDIKVDTKEAPVFHERSLWRGVILQEQ